MRTQTYTGVLDVMDCGECGVTFGLDAEFRSARQRDGRVWYCPNGHQRVYRETDEQRLRKEKEQVERDLIRARARADQAAADAEHQRNRVRGYQGALGKAKKRAAAGVCPAAGCKRHFANVAAHVARMHPDLATDPVEEVVVR